MVAGFRGWGGRWVSGLVIKNIHNRVAGYYGGNILLLSFISEEESEDYIHFLHVRYFGGLLKI